MIGHNFLLSNTLRNDIRPRKVFASIVGIGPSRMRRHKPQSSAVDRPRIKKSERIVRKNEHVQGNRSHAADDQVLTHALRLAIWRDGGFAGGQRRAARLLRLAETGADNMVHGDSAERGDDLQPRR